MGEVLSLEERKLLEQCESTIETGIAWYVRMGDALARIKDGKLYREHFDTFQEYCREKWDLSAESATQAMKAAKVHANLEAVGIPGPDAKSHAMALAALAEDKQAEAWVDVLTETKGNPTTNAVKDVVDRHERGGHSPSSGETMSRTKKVQFSPEDLQWVEEMAASRKISVSGYIRDLVHEDRKRNLKKS